MPSAIPVKSPCTINVPTVEAVKFPAFVIVCADAEVIVPTTWYFAAAPVPFVETVPTARDSAASVKSVVSVFAAVPAPVPQPMKCPSVATAPEHRSATHCSPTFVSTVAILLLLRPSDHLAHLCFSDGGRHGDLSLLNRAVGTDNLESHRRLRRHLYGSSRHVPFLPPGAAGGVGGFGACGDGGPPAGAPFSPGGAGGCSARSCACCASLMTAARIFSTPSGATGCPLSSTMASESLKNPSVVNRRMT